MTVVLRTILAMRQRVRTERAAGRTIGLKADVDRKAADVTQALDVVRSELLKRGINWEFELWKPSASSKRSASKARWATAKW